MLSHNPNSSDSKTKEAESLAVWNSHFFATQYKARTRLIVIKKPKTDEEKKALVKQKLSLAVKKINETAPSSEFPKPKGYSIFAAPSSPVNQYSPHAFVSEATHPTVRGSSSS